MLKSEDWAAMAAASARVEIEKMSIEQVRGVKEQADLEVNLFQDSLKNIRTGTVRLELASAALHDLSLRPQGKKLLMPLTASLYVPGMLDDAEKVLVDVGTGYFIESWLGSVWIIPQVTLNVFTADICGGNWRTLGKAIVVIKTMAEGKDYCERKISLLKSNDQLLEIYGSSSMNL
ncbi:prefoldin subunit 5 [Striga asiatica]|uniref:Prefoldin subunit 5 n=1 Tax=Striga asiatica TaxID=4170 RepID=A0A5A7QFB6_STRAF|nr:prefoldin subunit 5 [Striga asiatica]